MEEEEPYPKRCKLSKELLMQKSTTGLLETFGGGDVRIQALRTPEHCGLVDGLGKFFPSAHQFKDITTERRLADSESTMQAHAEQLNEEKTKDQCCQLELDSKENVVAPKDESLIKVKDEVDRHVHCPEDLVHTSQKVTNFQHVQKKRKLNPTIAVFSKLVDRCVDNSTLIELNKEEEPFGIQCSNDLHDSTDRCCINQLKDDGRLGQFAFINPASVSLQKATGTRFVFMPYNPEKSWLSL
ncbi:hypothetical protein Q3G72_029091 [Acer saccharum]|nr:hypothetical protein Q3G72_029091 [Acer saccharum]